MTTIAYRDGILVADRQTTCSNSRKECAKLWVLDDVAVAVAGFLSDGLKFCEWWRAGKPDGYSLSTDSTIVVVDLETHQLVEYDSNMVPMSIYGQFEAWGSGSDFALGAMEMGADAARAVEIGIIHDAYSGIGLSILDLNKTRKVLNYADWSHWKGRKR